MNIPSWWCFVSKGHSNEFLINFNFYDWIDAFEGGFLVLKRTQNRFVFSYLFNGSTTTHSNSTEALLRDGRSSPQDNYPLVPFDPSSVRGGSRTSKIQLRVIRYLPVGHSIGFRSIYSSGGRCWGAPRVEVANKDTMRRCSFNSPFSSTSIDHQRSTIGLTRFQSFVDPSSIELANEWATE